ncbi:MAG: ABC transporter ATP-binding protein [Acidimicrobiales bacterium]
MSGVVVRGLSKAFGRQPVLLGVDLTVADGSLTAILGASGSGKTTLLRVIAGFERADRGTVTLGGIEVDDGSRSVSPERRRIGYVPQDGALFPHLTVGANVAFGLSRQQRNDGRVQQHMEMVGIAGLSARYPHQLSGGQQQRVALARALVIDPQVVLLDEPFASLDASLRASVRADVHDVLRAAGTTTILVTHDQDEALSIADRVAVLRDGVIVQAATPKELYTRPIDAQLARFLGDANLVDAVIDRTSAATAFGNLPLVHDATPGAAVVLIRPEQLEVVEDPSGAGVVLSCEYYGHDAVVRVSMPGRAEPLVVRMPGDQVVRHGVPVRVRARGSVAAWPVAPS